MNRDTTKRLHDAHAAALDIQRYASGATRTDLVDNRELQLIFEQLFEILGEALSKADRLDPNLRERLSEAGDVIGMRNGIAHGYYEVSYRIFWDAAVGKVPALCTPLEQMLDE